MVQHQIFEYAQNYYIKNDENLLIKNNKLCLKNKTMIATFKSKEIKILQSQKIVASWGALTAKEATVEIKVKLLVDNEWSDLVSYGEWGLGRKNGTHFQENQLIKLDEDEIIVLNEKVASAIKYEVTLKRIDENAKSPEFSFISFALDIPNYKYETNTNLLPSEIIHNVPRLCQLVVPEIGNSICSPTTITMMLKYYGFNFLKYDEYEHRYIAKLSKDYGNDIFGNWVYCTVTASSFGLETYVAKMYSIEELMYHLTKGPVGLSVRGRMVSNEKDYTTKGHLLLAIGYKYIDGKLYFLCNDPNVNNVYCEYSVDVIRDTWRYIGYVINYKC